MYCHALTSIKHHKVLILSKYATISSIKKMREIIHFEIFMDWCTILFISSIYITDIIQRTLFMSQNCV